MKISLNNALIKGIVDNPINTTKTLKPTCQVATCFLIAVHQRDARTIVIVDPK